MHSASAARTLSGAPSWLDERTLRLAAALGILLFQLEGMLGLAWDIQWHISVGRDRFWTPPHILLYTSVALRGVLALAVVQLESLRYWRRSEVDDRNSIAVFGIFHAPLGFVVTGFGVLVTALAAPLDDYWHQLYGIDVELWAPFHMMGTLGGLIAGLGSVYIWSSLLVNRQQIARGAPRWTLERIGVAVALTFLMGQMLTLAWPGQLVRPTWMLGGLPMMTYPVLIAVGLTWLLIAASDTLGLRFAASALAVLLLVRDVAVQSFVPWAVRTGAAAEGFPFRSPALEPHFSAAPLIFDGALLLVALLADGLAWKLRRGENDRRPVLRGLVLGIALYSAGLWAALAVWHNLPKEGLPPEFPIGTAPTGLAMAVAFPMALALAALSGWLGGGLSHVWRRNAR